VSGPVLEAEPHTQDDETRRRAAHLRHLPLTTEYSLVELDLSGLLPASKASPV